MRKQVLAFAIVIGVIASVFSLSVIHYANFVSAAGAQTQEDGSASTDQEKGTAKTVKGADVQTGSETKIDATAQKSADTQAGTEPETDVQPVDGADAEAANGTDAQQDPSSGQDADSSAGTQLFQGKKLDRSVPPAPFDITINIAGDLMIASYRGSGKFADMARNQGPTPFLSNVKSVFEQDDLTIVNLETVLTDRALSEVPKGYSPAYWYKAPTSNTEILTCASVEAVSLANNHTGDYGEAGRKVTREAVVNAGLLYSDNDRTLYWQKNGYTVALICHGLWGDYQTDAILKRLEEAKTMSDFQIIYFHGGTERIHDPEQWKINSCHRLVDAGADLVIGNHPHCLQPREVYNGVDIIYSMGNFVVGDEMHPENRTIIYNLKLSLSGTGELLEKTSTIIPCYVHTGGDTNNFIPAIIENEEEKQQVLDFMNGLTDSPD